MKENLPCLIRTWAGIDIVSLLLNSVGQSKSQGQSGLKERENSSISCWKAWHMVGGWRNWYWLSLEAILPQGSCLSNDDCEFNYFPLSSVSFHFTYFETLLIGTDIFRIVMSS